MDINQIASKFGLEVRRKRQRTIGYNPLYYLDGDFETMNNHDFMLEEQFKHCWLRAVSTVKDDSHFYHYPWRVYTAAWFADQAFNVPGDYVEFGCHQGFMSMFIITKLLLNHETIRDHFLFDTFCGFDEGYVSTAEKAQAHYNDLKAIYRDNYDEVKRVFGKYSNVHLIKGSVPDTLIDDTAKAINNVSFCYVDMNCYYPEREALKWIWPKMSKGGIIMSDDQGQYSLNKQHDMWVKFAQSVDREMFYVPGTGQGVIVK